MARLGRTADRFPEKLKCQTFEWKTDLCRHHVDQPPPLMLPTIPVHYHCVLPVFFRMLRLAVNNQIWQIWFILPSQFSDGFQGNHLHWMEWLGATSVFDGFLMVLGSPNYRVLMVLDGRPPSVKQCDAMDHRSSLVKYSKPLEAINCPFYSLYLRIVMYRQLAITSYNTWMYWKRGQNSLLVWPSANSLSVLLLQTHLDRWKWIKD